MKRTAGILLAAAAACFGAWADEDECEDASATASFWYCRTTAAGSKLNGTLTLGAAPTTTSSATMKVDDGVVIHTTTTATSTWQARTKGDHTVAHTVDGVTFAATYSVTNVVFWQQAEPVPPMAVDETIVISPTNKVFATSRASGATIQTSTTSSNGTWTAEASDAWITLPAAKSGSAGARVPYSVAENVGAETRVGYVYVAGHVHTVTQPGRGVTATVDRENLSVDVAGGSASVTVTPSDATTTWHARSEADWLSVSPTETRGSGVVTVTAAPWCELTSRTGTVVVVDRRITVVQSGGSFVESIEVSASGDTATLAVIATNGLAWTATSDADWLTVSPTTGTGNGVVRWTAEPQTTFEERLATIKVTAAADTNLVLQTTTVTQQAARVWFEGETTRRYDAGGAFNEAVTVRVDVADMPWTVNVSTNAANNWINLVSASSQKGDDVEIRFMVYDASEADLPRTATISVGNAILRIIQGDALLIEDGDTEFFIPTTWLSRYYPNASEGEWQEIVESTGLKTDASGAALPVWQDYVAGTDPTNALSKFETTIVMSNGVPVITWSPALNGEGVREGVRVYRVWGKTNLTDTAWIEVASGVEAAYHFFRVTVEMP